MEIADAGCCVQGYGETGLKERLERGAEYRPELVVSGAVGLAVGVLVAEEMDRLGQARTGEEQGSQPGTRG